MGSLLVSSAARLAAVLLAVSGLASAQVYDLTADWSDIQNPNGAWSLRDGSRALPGVPSWQSTLGGWATPQPAWSHSENGNDRLPVWFKSNGTESFGPDFVAGDVVVHGWDSLNGVGNGEAEVAWTCQAAGTYDVELETWLGRDQGRAMDWSMAINGVQQSSGNLFTGDPFSRQNPATSSLSAVAFQVGDEVTVEFVKNSTFGEFVGVRMRVHPTGSFTTSGSGCPALSPPVLSISGEPELGTTRTIQVSNLPLDTTLALTNFGTSMINLPLDNFGAPGCEVLIGNVYATIVMANTPPTASFPFTIPNSTSFVGVFFDMQSGGVSASANALGLVVTGRARLTIGG